MVVAFLLQDTGSIYGAQRATLDLLSGLHASGRVRPVVFLLDETRLALASSPFRDALRAAGPALEILPVRGAFSWAAIRRIRRLLRHHGAAVIHSVGPKADLFAWLASAGGRARRVSTVHGWLFRRDPKERLHEAVNRFCLRRSDRVICLSTAYENRLHAAGVRGDRISLIPSGFSPGELSDVPQGVPKPYDFGWMGRFSEEKDVGLFLDAVARVPSGRFLLAGDGPLRPRVEARLARPDIAGRVTLAGYLPRRDFFSAVGGLVMTSRMENLPYTILEAMACRLPVIATRVGGIPDLVEPGVTGLLVPPGDAGALAEAMSRLLADRGLGARLGEAGWRRLTERFAPARALAAHEALYLGPGGAG